jgi:hypothetical protein
MVLLKINKYYKLTNFCSSRYSAFMTLLAHVITRSRHCSLTSLLAHVIARSRHCSLTSLLAHVIARSRHCERSEANCAIDCFVASLLAMTAPGMMGIPSLRSQ